MQAGGIPAMSVRHGNLEAALALIAAVKASAELATDIKVFESTMHKPLFAPDTKEFESIAFPPSSAAFKNKVDEIDRLITQVSVRVVKGNRVRIWPIDQESPQESSSIITAIQECYDISESLIPHTDPNVGAIIRKCFIAVVATSIRRSADVTVDEIAINGARVISIKSRSSGRIGLHVIQNLAEFQKHTQMHTQRHFECFHAEKDLAEIQMHFQMHFRRSLVLCAFKRVAEVVDLNYKQAAANFARSVAEDEDNE